MKPTYSELQDEIARLVSVITGMEEDFKYEVEDLQEDHCKKVKILMDEIKVLKPTCDGGLKTIEDLTEKISKLESESDEAINKLTACGNPKLSVGNMFKVRHGSMHKSGFPGTYRVSQFIGSGSMDPRYKIDGSEVEFPEDQIERVTNDALFDETRNAHYLNNDNDSSWS